MRKMIEYFKRHWRGDHHILQASMVNGILTYIVTVGAVLLVAERLNWPALSTPQLAATVLLLLSIFGWSGVGIGRAAVRTIKDQRTHPGWKIFAAFVSAILAAAIVATMRDIYRLFL